MGRPRNDKPRVFPIEPLLERTPGTGIKTKARALEEHPRQLHRWRHYGLTIDQADELACRIGRHPIEIWPELWAAETDAEWLCTFIICRDNLRLRRWVRDWCHRNDQHARAA